MLTRRGLFGLLGSAPMAMVAPQPAGAEAEVPLPNGESIEVRVHGSVDGATLPQVKAMIDAQAQLMRAEMQRNFGSMQARRNSRFSS